MTNQFIWRRDFFLPNILITHTPTSIHCCRLIFSLAQQFLLSHCALPHQSTHTGGATNECSWGFTILKQMGDQTFVLRFLFLKKTMLYHIYIVTLLLELFHNVQCISSIMSNVLVICIFRLYVVKSYQEKNAWLLGKKSLCLCALV